MFEVQEIEVTPCNQSEGKLHISLSFEDLRNTHKTNLKQQWGNYLVVSRGRSWFDY